MGPVTASEVEWAVTRAGVHAWTLRTCSICEAPLNYYFHPDLVAFDPSCECTRWRSGPRASSFEEVAADLNRQVPDERARMWAELLRPPAVCCGSQTRAGACKSTGEIEVGFGLSIADPSIPWPARGSAERSLCERPGWRRVTIPSTDGILPCGIEAMCRGQLAVNLMVGGDEGFAICLARNGFRLSYGGRVFARCKDAMIAAEALMDAVPVWQLTQSLDYTEPQRAAMRDIMESAERRGEILLDRVFPR